MTKLSKEEYSQYDREEIKSYFSRTNTLDSESELFQGFIYQRLETAINDILSSDLLEIFEDTDLKEEVRDFLSTLPEKFQEVDDKLAH